VEIEQVVAAEYGFVGNAGFFENLAEFRVHALVFSLPEGAEGILVGVTGIGGRLIRQGETRGILDKAHAAIGAAGEAGTVFGIALRAEHALEVYNRRRA
jgi:hypothetical protein